MAHPTDRTGARAGALRSRSCAGGREPRRTLRAHRHGAVGMIGSIITQQPTAAVQKKVKKGPSNVGHERGDLGEEYRAPTWRRIQAPMAMGSTASVRLNFEGHAKNASTVFGLTRATAKVVQGLAVEARGRDGELKRAHRRQAFSLF